MFLENNENTAFKALQFQIRNQFEIRNWNWIIFTKIIS